MNRTIWKFPLPRGTRQAIAAGPGPVVLAAMDPYSGHPAVWIEHDPAMAGSRTFAVVGTGAGIPAGMSHVGSMVDGRRIWHVYEGPAV